MLEGTRHGIFLIVLAIYPRIRRYSKYLLFDRSIRYVNRVGEIFGAMGICRESALSTISKKGIMNFHTPWLESKIALALLHFQEETALYIRLID